LDLGVEGVFDSRARVGVEHGSGAQEATQRALKLTVAVPDEGDEARRIRGR
jgi:hypothetical protein